MAKLGRPTFIIGRCGHAAVRRKQRSQRLSGVALELYEGSLHGVSVWTSSAVTRAWCSNTSIMLSPASAQLQADALDALVERVALILIAWLLDGPARPI